MGLVLSKLSGAKGYLNYASGIQDSDVRNFINATGITDSTQRKAINDLVFDLKTYNLWTKQKALYPVVGGTSAAHAVNLKTPGTYNLSFTAGWVHSANGALPNGSSDYANTNLIPNNILTIRNTHLSIYSRTDTSAGNKADFGCANVTTANPSMFLSPKYLVSSLATSDAYNNTTNRLSISNTNSTGFYISSRTAINIHKIYKNQILLGSESNNEVNNSMPNVQLTIGGFNFGGSIVQFTDRQYAFASIGDGLTDTEAANFYTAVQKFQTTLGRQV